MTITELKQEIYICESAIDSLTNFMKDYGTKKSDMEKIILIKEYKQRLEKAQKELGKKGGEE